MNLLTCILIAIPIGIIFIMLWIYNDYRKYKKKISCHFAVSPISNHFICTIR